MAKLLNGNVLTALVAGIVGAAIAPHVLPRLSNAARPAAKGAIKTGLALYERGRETLAEWGETAEDLVAEVQAEREEDLQKQGPRPVPPASAEKTAAAGAGDELQGSGETAGPEDERTRADG
ncbi:DUF5132 domain-containing protein [Inquilinus limosus]|uniref:DUF5132 domain-containing protein n=1 Tax=Inquilinus limosus TaxID=171674 RepID=UPI003F18D666